jgi:hypothetical protein
MNLKGIENLLKQLGYVLENGDTYVLKDERVALNFYRALQLWIIDVDWPQLGSNLMKLIRNNF